MSEKSDPSTPPSNSHERMACNVEPLTPLSPPQMHQKPQILPPLKCPSLDPPENLTVSSSLYGVGTFSNVRTANIDGKMYALKTPRKNTLLHTFNNELQALKALNIPGHPNVIGFHGCWGVDGLILDFYEWDIEKAVKSMRSMQHSTDMCEPIVGQTRWLNWLCKLSSALEYIHEKGIVHADLKPNNLLINKDLENPVIADFSYAVMDAESIGMSSPIYSAPELLQDTSSEPTFATDIYALGVVMLFCATGAEAYSQAKNAYQRAVWQKQMPPQNSYEDEQSLRLSQVRPEVEQLITQRKLRVAK